MSDFAYEEDSYTSNKIDWNVWKKIFSFLKPIKKFVILSIAAMAVLAATDAIYPYISKFAIDEIIAPNQGVVEVNLDKLPVFIGMYVVFMIIQAIMVYLFIYWAGKVQTELAYNIRKKAFHHLQVLPFSYYDRTRVGWIMARMTSDSRNLSDILSWGIIDFTWGVFLMVTLIVVMFLINPILALIAIAIVPVLFVISTYFRRHILKAYRSIRKVNSKITGAYNEGLTGAVTTKTLVLEQANFNDFDGLTTDMRKQSIRAAMFQGMYFPTVIFLISIGIALVYYAGGNMVFEKAISVGTLYLFTSYVWQFFDPVNNIATIFAQFQQAQASAERIVSLIETKPEIADTDEVVNTYGTLFDYKRENFEPLMGDVAFRNVTFKYHVGEQVLTDFNLDVKAGESIALVGHTGAGKTTIVNLICRFYEPTAGQILIDGVDYKKRSLGWLHSNLGYVLQDPHLFSGSVMENIRYGKLSASDEEVIEAAKAVEAHEFIMRFEKGYQTECGEGGSRLSVGQKQLVSFARAILADPKILVLDEATSSVDTETEQLIQTAIHRLLKGRTSFIVAHRLSTIVHSDRILVLEDGRVIESGSHRELIQSQGHYYKLYTNQYSEEMLERSKH
ncbi:MAG: ABC transporter ATP-binding protein [Candidatus Izemoplasmatales bacterium]|nr:ABC transporter ATP-binding protein [Candidatus Izemoplasmatales bacterium]MDD5292802.1 ABC transporter ATP-binding protein [Candidatus Izemoplasmatales bacterium]